MQTIFAAYDIDVMEYAPYMGYTVVKMEQILEETRSRIRQLNAVSCAGKI